MIIISCSPSWLAEKQYIIDIIFNEFLGLPYELRCDSNDDDYYIWLNDKTLTVKNHLFTSSRCDYLIPSALPEASYSKNSFSPENDIPILCGGEELGVSSDGIHCDNDIFANCFFMLSRMEEAIGGELDAHDRFPASSSIAYKYKFLDRPVVDEYTEMLWNMLVFLDPELQRKTVKPCTFVTCDMDAPFDPVRRSLKKTISSSALGLLAPPRFSTFITIWKNYAYQLFGITRYDDFRENIDWIMSANEKMGNNVAFYFITKATSKFDGTVDFSSAEMLELLKDIHSRGHEIGLHPGYDCFDNEEHFKNAAAVLRKGMARAGIEQDKIGGRMHYLRWNIMKTPQLWELEGFQYDSTLGYADQAGFRCGTSKEFTMFDLLNRRPLALKQRPLVNMECTIISPEYENLGYSDRAIRRFLSFKEKSHRYKGIYTILWHNSHMNNIKDKEFYREIIQ